MNAQIFWFDAQIGKLLSSAIVTAALARSMAKISFADTGWYGPSPIPVGLNPTIAGFG